MCVYANVCMYVYIYIYIYVCSKQNIFHFGPLVRIQIVIIGTCIRIETHESKFVVCVGARARACAILTGNVAFAYRFCFSFLFLFFSTCANLSVLRKHALISNNGNNDET